MPTEETYKDLFRGQTPTQLLESVRADLNDAIDGAPETEGADRFYSDLITRLDVALEKMREVR